MLGKFFNLSPSKGIKINVITEIEKHAYNRRIVKNIF